MSVLEEVSACEPLISRAPLVSRLMAARGASLAMLTAPAGYGKSAVLSQWAEQDGRPFAWIALEPAHNDPMHLMRCVAAATARFGCISEQDVAAAAGVAEARLLLRSAIAQVAQPFVLALEDAQKLRAPAALDVLAMLIEHLAAGSQIAIASRAQPALPIGRLRASRRLIELRAGDLVMTRREAASLACAMGAELSQDGVDLLVRNTEGWPVGLYLALRAGREDPDPPAALTSFTGDDRAVAEYIREELLAGLSAAERDFLIESSVLERVSGPACDYVLGREGSARLLWTLSRMNVLLVPLDRTDTEFRYHRLLAQMLRGELRRCDPERARALHIRASDWHASSGTAERAIAHAIAAGDPNRAGALIWRHAAEFLGYGNAVKLLSWLDRIGEEGIADSCALALSAAATHLFLGDRSLAEHWLAAARRALPGEHGPHRCSMQAGILVFSAAVATGGIGAMAVDALKAYEAAPEVSPWRALACLLRGVSKHLRAEPEEARTWLEEGARRGAVAVPAIQAQCLAQLALLAIDRDDWDAAELLAARARRQVDRAGLEDYATSALVYAVSADVQARIGRVEVSQSDAREAARILSSLPELMPWYAVECSIALARAALRLSDVTGAQRLLSGTRNHLRGLSETSVAEGWYEDCRAQAELAAKAHARGGWTLTTAELRVLQYLPTHLSFPEIADRLYVSANTVKTHTRAVYRKLDATSRGQAVIRAREAGLLDPIGKDAAGVGAS